MNTRTSGGNPGSREPSQSSLSRPVGFDPGRIRCDGCGRFIADADLEHSKHEFTPLNEFGPEESAWVCPRCVEKERNQ